MIYDLKFNAYTFEYWSKKKKYTGYSLLERVNIHSIVRL